MNSTYTNQGVKTQPEKFSKERELEVRRIAELVALDVRKILNQAIKEQNKKTS